MFNPIKFVFDFDKKGIRRYVMLRHDIQPTRMIFKFELIWVSLTGYQIWNQNLLREFDLFYVYHSNIDILKDIKSIFH